MADKAEDKTSAKILSCRAEEISFEEEFDAVIGFGQSMNYITEEETMNQVLKSAFNSLENGGVLIFDFMTNLEDFRSDFRTYRTGAIDFSVCEKFEPAENSKFYLEFHYKIEKGSDRAEFSEKHLIRDWDTDKVEKKLKESGFSLIERLKIYGKSFSHIKAVKKR